MRSPLSAAGALFGAALVGLLVLPLIALAMSSSWHDIVAGVADPMFAPAMGLSLRTTLVTLALTVVGGTPLAWWLATSTNRLARVVEVLVDLPIVIPPAVVGVALLKTYGRRGLLGPVLEPFGVQVSFTEAAVIIAQLTVSAPFFVQAAANAFRRIEPDMLIVARTLGASAPIAFIRIALPMTRSGIIVGASLAWARALGEFGATLLFAGNMTGKTQTMPLAIFSALETDVRLAVVFSLFLGGGAALLMLGVRLLPTASGPPVETSP